MQNNIFARFARGNLVIQIIIGIALGALLATSAPDVAQKQAYLAAFCQRTESSCSGFGFCTGYSIHR